MTDITTTHKDYGIRYSENEDVWRCWDLDMEAARLGTLKAKIDKFLLEYRRVSVPAIHLAYDGPAEVVITLIEDEEGVPPWRRGKDHRKVHVTKPKGAAGVARNKVSTSELCPDTPEVREAIARYREAAAIARAANKAADAAKEAIPRITMDEIKAALPEPTSAPPT